MRRLPMYFLVDTSASMQGEPLDEVRMGVRMLVSEMRKDPMALEVAYLSVITFGDTAQQVVPLTALAEFKEPTLEAGGGASLGAALEELVRCAGCEVVKTTADTKGDWKPQVFLMTNGRPTDAWEDAVKRVKENRWNITACAAGAEADETLLKSLTDVVVRLRDEQPSSWQEAEERAEARRLAEQRSRVTVTRNVYLLVDVSCAVPQEGLEHTEHVYPMGRHSLCTTVSEVEHAIRLILEHWCKNESLAERLAVTLITVHDGAELMVHSADIGTLVCPTLQRDDGSSPCPSLAAGLRVVAELEEGDPGRCEPERRPPVVLLFTSGSAAAGWKDEAVRVKEGTGASCGIFLLRESTTNADLAYLGPMGRLAIGEMTVCRWGTGPIGQFMRWQCREAYCTLASVRDDGARLEREDWPACVQWLIPAELPPPSDIALVP